MTPQIRGDGNECWFFLPVTEVDTRFVTSCWSCEPYNALALGWTPSIGVEWALLSFTVAMVLALSIQYAFGDAHEVIASWLRPAQQRTRR